MINYGQGPTTRSSSLGWLPRSQCDAENSNRHVESREKAEQVNEAGGNRFLVGGEGRSEGVRHRRDARDKQREERPQPPRSPGSPCADLVQRPRQEGAAKEEGGEVGGALSGGGALERALPGRSPVIRPDTRAGSGRGRRWRPRTW